MLDEQQSMKKGSYAGVQLQNDSVLSAKHIEPIPEIVEIHNKPIFKLLKAFKLQQYAIVSHNRLHKNPENDRNGLWGGHL